MGILNVTPDSFSDGGLFASAEAAIAQGRRLVDEGADILDIGGESTRPGAEEVAEDEEIRRVVPVIEALRRQAPAAIISIDTYRAETARRAILAGARIVNDVWGLQRDPAMAELVARTGTGLVAMHNRREKDPALDIVADIERAFEASLARADRAGIPRARIALDPGIGFGKTFEQNLAAIRAIPRLKAFGCAILLGVSRKSFLGLITGRPVDERLAASIAANGFGLMAGADIIRVHDVAPHRDAARVIAAIESTENNGA
jgi:dihydropteroate synthase